MKKSKIIALLMATACMVSAFAGCNDEGGATSSPTDCNHIDTDKNGSCDTCKQAVVLITEEVMVPAEKEQEVEMVVNALPTDAKASDYIGPKAEDEEAPLFSGMQKTTVFDDKEVKKIDEITGKLFLLNKKTIDEETLAITADVWEVYDAAVDKVLYTFDCGAYQPNDNHTYVEVDFSENGYFRVTESVWKDTEYDYERTVKYYTKAGELIVKSEEDKYIHDFAVNVVGAYEYVTVNDEEVYVIDVETQKLVTMEGVPTNDELVIERPEFQEVKGDLGYIYEGSKIWVYDLTKWVSLTYYFEMPSYWTTATTMTLDNGNILVQYQKTLPASAVNYDVLISGAKVDLVQVVIDPKTGEQKTVELGYLLGTMDESAKEKYNDNAKNLVVLTPIEDKELNGNAKFEAVIDAELNVLYAHKATLPAQTEELTYITEGVYQSSINHGGVTVDILVDGEGKELAKLPTNRTSFYGHVSVGDKVYSYDMKSVLFELTDYTVQKHDDYAILVKTETVEEEEVTTYYYYNGEMNAPVKIGKVAQHRENYFVVEITVGEPGAEETTYEVYNSANEKIVTLEANVYTFGATSENIVKLTDMAGNVIYFRK